MTMESEDDPELHSQNYIDKQVIGRYLLDFLKLEVAGGPSDKKLAAIATAVQVLGLCEGHYSLVLEYGKKIKHQSKSAIVASNECG